MWKPTYLCIFTALTLINEFKCAPVTNFTVERANKYIEENKYKVNQTYRLKYHLAAPIGWINDPNGFVYYQGEYHLFYQYNPYASEAANIHWGHAKSKDLLHWEDLPVALAPDQIYDKDGVFSGSAIEKDGKLYVMYTGNTGNRQVQCIAVSEDGITFNKIPENPVLDASFLPPNAEPADFRDPKVFKRGEKYFVVTGSRTKNNTGQILLFESDDLIKWEFKSILLEGAPQYGNMWECPDFFNLDGKDVLITSPIQMPRSGDDYRNIDSVVEFVGTMDWDSGMLEVEGVKEIDHGLDFYATQTLLDDKGRRIVVAWMNMWGRNYPTAQLGHDWAGAMTLPRELHIEDGLLVQTPIAEMSNVSINLIQMTNVTLKDGKQFLNGVSGDICILALTVNLQNAQTFKIDLRMDKEERTIVSYNTTANKVILDRSKSGINIVGSEKPPLHKRAVDVPLIDERLKLEIFLDKSSIEVFINDGKETMTANIYPRNVDSQAIQFEVVGEVVIEELSLNAIEM